MPHGAEEQNGVPADSPCLRRTAQEPIRYSPELGIVPERMPTEVVSVTLNVYAQAITQTGLRATLQ